ncbi:ty3-gypsy retrotransposon protein [Cucumis melo var. makuwa]|uniref:Ty3-gypsy retrotransposon protein n=1 Tax=Cucumis melo var. makuwa TaxID=1194695 RepID=A0A5A7UG81_CUCMM|nr:ty3-gypsy retrotransposon protein [Cucumis melo var. makuwa]
MDGARLATVWLYKRLEFTDDTTELATAWLCEQLEFTYDAPLLRDFERVEIAVSVGEHRLVEAGKGEDFSISSNDGLMFDRRLCVLKDSAVKTELLTEALSSPFTMQPGSTKMYQNLRRVYWWRNMKREMADFINRDFRKRGQDAP